MCVDYAIANYACGSCGHKCDLGENCVGGTCVCRPGDAVCNGNCVGVKYNQNNCGACNVPCALPTGLCAGGACVANCPNGTVQCNGGCIPPADFLTDPRNCGNCKHQCGAGQVCAAGQCQWAAVAPGCAQCPCPECGSERVCCPGPVGGSPNPLCVVGDVCP